MRCRTSLLTAGAVLVLVAPAMARPIPRRARNQERRIEAGVASGRLTAKETQQLERQQKQIAQERADAAADGHVTAAERREIRHDQRVASRRIFRDKHNLRRVP